MFLNSQSRLSDVLSLMGADRKIPGKFLRLHQHRSELEEFIIAALLKTSGMKNGSV